SERCPKSDQLLRFDARRFRIFQYVRQMDRAPLDCGATEDRAARWRNCVAGDVSAPLGLVAERCCEHVTISVTATDGANIGCAQPCWGLNQGVEDGLQIELGIADDLQDLASRRLIFERLLQLGRLRLHRLKQPHVFDRDYRLVGEGSNQFDLVIVEYPYGSAS